METEIEELAKVASVEWVLGNHDYKNRDFPFFRFIGKYQNVRLHEFNFTASRAGVSVGFFPHIEDSKEVLQAVRNTSAEVCLLHCTVPGVVTSAGFVMDSGVEIKGTNKLVISGDIHLPQKVGDVLYVGSPYQTTFGPDLGDKYDNRILLLEKGSDGVSLKSIPTDFPRKVIVSVSVQGELIDSSRVMEGDFVRFKVVGARKEDLMSWEEICDRIRRKYCSVTIDAIVVDSVQSDKPTRKVLLRRGSVSRSEDTVFSDYCSKQDVVPVVRAFGERIIQNAKK
jgi:hypothetical protein